MCNQPFTVTTVEDAAVFVELTLDATDEMGDRQRAVLAACDEGRGEDGVLDLGPRQVEDRQCFQRCTGRCGPEFSQDLVPDLATHAYVGARKVEDVADPSGEGWVDVGFFVAGHHDNASEVFDELEQVVGVGVGVAVVGIPNIGTLGKQRVGFVKKQHRTHACGSREDPPEILGCLADVLRHGCGEVDPHQVEAELVGEDLGSQGLAGPSRAGEQRDESGSPRVQPLGRGQVPKLDAVAGFEDELVEVLAELARDDQVVETKRAREDLSEVAEVMARAFAGTSPT